MLQQWCYVTAMWVYVPTADIFFGSEVGTPTSILTFIILDLSRPRKKKHRTARSFVGEEIVTGSSNNTNIRFHEMFIYHNYN